MTGGAIDLLVSQMIFIRCSLNEIVAFFARSRAAVRAVAARAFPVIVDKGFGLFLHDFKAVPPFMTVGAKLLGAVYCLVSLSRVVPVGDGGHEGLVRRFMAYLATDVLPFIFRHRDAAFQIGSWLTGNALT
jgi:hypothetical protein